MVYHAKERLRREHVLASGRILRRTMAKIAVCNLRRTVRVLRLFALKKHLPELFVFKYALRRSCIRSSSVFVFALVTLLARRS